HRQRHGHRVLGDQVGVDALSRISIIHKKNAEGLTKIGKPSAMDLCCRTHFKAFRHICKAV
ncbi:MAG: hypothetical protein OEV45_09340, partial [Desulfobacteraceae bacterium]|nr:hypothetical protein [Desulfobacteraceae bacterium]